MIVVEGVAAKPALGYTVGGLAAPTVWVKDVPTWARAAPRVKASGATAGAIALPATTASEATLFVIVGDRR